MKKLVQHFERMQTCVGNYLPPESYTPQFGPAAGKESLAEGPDKEAAFIGDLIWALDGPEQREAQAEASFDFVAESMLTCSSEFHGDKVSISEVLNALQDFSAAAERLDRIKKSLFYGRDYIPNPTRPHPSTPGEAEASHRIVNDVSWRLMLADGDDVGEVGKPLTQTERYALTVDLFHSILGVATESGEMVDAWLAAYKHSKSLDLVNLQEEFGDNQWYVAVALNAFGKLFGIPEGRSFDDLHVMVNKKLRHRFPDGFTAYDANNRDLTGERAILEMPTTGFAQVMRGEGKSDLPADYLEKFAGMKPADGATFTVEEVEAGQDVFSTLPDYDPRTSHKARDCFPDEPHSGVDPANGKHSDEK